MSDRRHWSRSILYAFRDLHEQCSHTWTQVCTKIDLLPNEVFNVNKNRVQ